MVKSRTILQALTLGLAFVFLVTTAQAADLPRAAPADVGLSAERLERIDAFLERQTSNGQLASMQMLVARHGKVAYFKSAGVKDIVTGAPVEDDTIFRIYSQTKPITSVAILMLYEEGRLSLSDPVSKHLQELKGLNVYVSGEGDDIVSQPASREVTIHDLLTHQSGFSYYPLQQTAIARLYGAKGISAGRLTLDGDAEAETVDLAEFVERLGTVPLSHEPGTMWHYSVSVDVLGRVIEVVSGQSLDQFFEDHIFAPLGMVDTGFMVPADKLDRFTVNYMRDPDGNLVQVDPANGLYAQKPVLLSGGGGLVSTAADYFQFAQMLLNRGELNGVRILSGKTVDYMTQNHLPAGDYVSYYKGVGFGLGLGVLVDTAKRQELGTEGEYYWGGAAGTEWFVSPKDDLVVLFMTQLMFNTGTQNWREIRRLAYQAIISD